MISEGIDVTTPAIVGAFEMRPEMVVEGPVEAAALVAGVEEAPDVAVVDAAVVAVDACWAAVPVIVLRFGRSLSVDCANILATKSKVGRRSVHREDMRIVTIVRRMSKRSRSCRQGIVCCRLRIRYDASLILPSLLIMIVM